MNLLHKYGIEACQAKARALVPYSPMPKINVGGKVETNDRWPDASFLPGFADFNTEELRCGRFYYVICEQVIEHLHNQPWFIRQLRRITVDGGKLILSTENLLSLPNRLAMLLGIVPFSLQPNAGKYRGGWKRGKCSHGDVALNDPRWGGINGHIRLNSTDVLCDLLEENGWRVDKVHSFAFGHFILIEATAI